MTLFQPPYPPQELVTFGGFTIVQDDSNRLGIFNPSGTEIWDIDASGDVSVGGALTVTGLATFNAGITGTGNTGSLTAGSGILGTANTWSALQTFGNNISIGGATFDVVTLATGNFLYYNGTNWINQSLAAGTGISVSDYTISNTGIISLSAGSGISVSGTNPATITNTGVLSISNSDGSLTISPTTGASVASLNTAHSNTWSAEQTIGALTVDDGAGGTPFTPNGNTAFAFYNAGFSSYAGTGEWLAIWRDNGNFFAPLIGEQNLAFIIAFANDSSTAVAGLAANSGTMAFQVDPTGAVYTGAVQNYAVPVASGTSHSISIRNTLDDGSGNMSVAGNKGIELNNGAYANYFWVYSEGVVGFFGNEYTTPIIDVGTNVTQQNANSNGLPAPNTSYGGGLFRLDLRTGNPSGLTGLTEGPQWYVLLQPSGTAGAGTPIFGVDVGGHVSSIKNTLDDGSGNMTVAGALKLASKFIQAVTGGATTTNGQNFGANSVFAGYSITFPYYVSGIVFVNYSSTAETPTLSANTGGSIYMQTWTNSHNTFTTTNGFIGLFSGFNINVIAGTNSGSEIYVVWWQSQ